MLLGWTGDYDAADNFLGNFFSNLEANDFQTSVMPWGKTLSDDLKAADAVAELSGPRLARVEDVLRRQGVAAVVVARLTPVLPFTIVNYGAGVSAVPRRDFLVGTAVGIVPGTVGYAALGASAGQESR